jgi:hypothetical protein
VLQHVLLAVIGAIAAVLAIGGLCRALQIQQCPVRLSQSVSLINVIAAS